MGRGEMARMMSTDSKNSEDDYDDGKGEGEAIDIRKCSWILFIS